MSLHRNAKPSHYNSQAEQYDTLNEERSELINRTIEGILKKHGAKTILDLTCGTGSQVFYLAKQGYEVVGSDISSKMLQIARKKSEDQNRAIRFIQGDMRTVQAGHFDGAITIFNAVGHLTKRDFEKAMTNIHKNLTGGGLYLFDIFNLSYLLADDNITKLTIDWQKRTAHATVRKIQYSTIDPGGTLASYTISHVQEGSNKPRVSKSTQTLQVYTATQLQEMLHRTGFKVLNQTSVDGSELVEDQTECILTTAQKI